ncbi:cocaine- and amphetamine-regulated transcript protein [Conger conger]|uniref:cocaine- and amphetamine-regulated transcript protein n=1 Tax=Conger conger TaxID=82655 RepID=UPI002A5A7EE5|nr:cocaine- and amphetamine-regulated transcript protein [Conger conger]
MANLPAISLALLVFVYVYPRSCGVHARLAEDWPPETVDTEEQKKELMGVLHNVLEDLQKRQTAILRRRFSRLPGFCRRLRRRIITRMCNVGDFCSVKKGARYGQLCRCPRGSKCKYFFLKHH